MRVERVTVTTAPTSIQALMQAARPSTAVKIPQKCTVITLKYLPSETVVVQVSDEGTANKVTVLDNVTEGIGDCFFRDFDISLILLSTVAGNVDVDIVISQGRVT